MTVAMAIADLQDEVEGRVLRPGDEGFAEAALPWNVAVQHEPDVLLEAASPADVAAGVRWAAAHNLPIAAQSTGHGVTDAMHDGLLISTRLLKDIEVDAEARTARVGAGVQWKELLPQIVPHGLIALNGSSSDVGIVGYLLGGGLPVLGRAFGFAADYVRSIDVVPPDGRSRTVDAEHDPDLFAVLKGGKGNFGVVTGIELDLIPLTEFYGGSIMYPGEDAEEIFTAFRAWVRDLPDDACPSIALLRMPPEEFIPEPLRGRFLVHLRFAYPGSAEEGDRLVAPMRQASTPVMDMVGPLSYEQVDLVSMDPVDPLPFENGGALLTDFDEETQRALLDVAGPGKQFPVLMVELRLLGGALAKPSPVLDAVSGRDAAWITQAVGVLAPPIAAMVPSAIAAFLEALRPWSTGRTLVNFHGRPGDAEDRARAWSPDAYDAITAAKRRYDPENLMRFGHAVQLPSGEPAEAALPLL